MAGYRAVLSFRARLLSPNFGVSKKNIVWKTGCRAARPYY